jgi:hypothetical protein
VPPAGAVAGSPRPDVVLSDDDDIGDEVDYDSPYDGDVLCINCNQPMRLCRGNCDN